MSFETTALLVTWVALVLLALVVAGLVRQAEPVGSVRALHALVEEAGGRAYDTGGVR